MYTSPNNKYYVGQTINESCRRNTFLNPKKDYCTGGESAIDNARRKHGVNNFKYTIIFEKEFQTKLDAKVELDILEIKYIQEYDSYLNGYNSTLGGESRVGHKWTEAQVLKVSGENHHGYGKKVLYKDRPELRKPVLVYDKNDNFIIEYDSIKITSLSLGLNKSNICKVLKGKLITSGGYKFKYK